MSRPSPVCTGWVFGLALGLVSLAPAVGLAQPKEKRVLKERKEVFAAAFSPDGKTLASTGDKMVRLWEVDTGRLLHTFEVKARIGRAVAFSPDGKTLAFAGQDEPDGIRLWETETKKELPAIAGPSCWYVGFSPDGKTVLGPRSELLDATSRKVVTTLEEKRAELSLAFCPSKEINLVAGSYATNFYVWDSKTGKLLKDMMIDGKAVWAVAFSPDGKLLATGGLTSRLKLFKVSTWEEIALNEDKDANDSVRAVAFSPDGKILASANEKGVITLWDVAEQKKLASLKGAEGQGQVVAFSPDGKTLATVGKDGIVLWEVRPAK